MPIYGLTLNHGNPQRKIHPSVADDIIAFFGFTKVFSEKILQFDSSTLSSPFYVIFREFPFLRGGETSHITDFIGYDAAAVFL